MEARALEKALIKLGFKVGEYDGVMQATLRITGYGEIVMQLHRNFFSVDNTEMCVLCYNDTNADSLYMGAEPKTIKDLLCLLHMLFPKSSLANVHSGLFDDKDFVECFDSMEKYLEWKGDIFVPIIYKHENEFCHNSIWIMYAREGVDSFSRKKVLFHVKAGTLQAGLAMFNAVYNEHCAEKSIRGREWHGGAPYSLDFEND